MKQSNTEYTRTGALAGGDTTALRNKMDRTERLYLISQLLAGRRPVPFRVLERKLEVSAATLKRDLQYLRDRLHAPIVWDREARGYKLDERASGQGGPRFELPGMWFNASEAHALLAMEHLLENLQPGLLSPHVEPLKAQVRALLDSGDHAIEEVEKRIKLLPMGRRAVPSEHFALVAQAVLSRKRLRITHYHRQRDETLEREVSPQRLVHYRGNWYLDTWDHLRDAIRVFALDAITAATLLTTRAKSVADKELDEELATSYGIFTGKPKHKALLRFTPQRARWVSREQWHPQQRSCYDDEGYYLLEIPYSDGRELVMDILKHGAEVKVLRPEALRATVVNVAAHMRDINIG